MLPIASCEKAKILSQFRDISLVNEVIGPPFVKMLNKKNVLKNYMLEIAKMQKKLLFNKIKTFLCDSWLAPLTLALPCLASSGRLGKGSRGEGSMRSEVGRPGCTRPRASAWGARGDTERRSILSTKETLQQGKTAQLNQLKGMRRSSL